MLDPLIDRSTSWACTRIIQNTKVGYMSAVRDHCYFEGKSQHPRFIERVEMPLRGIKVSWLVVLFVSIDYVGSVLSHEVVFLS